MRVLMLHNRYRARGGEERAVIAITALLRRRGHHVELLERDSSSVGAGRAARAMLRGGVSEVEVEEAVARFRPDVVHAHNLHPLFGWRALAVARAGGARTVLHLHNYRLYCAIGVAFRDGAPCHECHGRNTLPGLMHRCRGGLPEAAVYAAGLASQQRRLLAAAHRLVALSTRQATLLEAHGLMPGRLEVIPNFIPDTDFAVRSGAGEGGYALVAGRLVAEKGFDVAVMAAREARVPLVVAGTGPDEQRLRGLAAGADVRFEGWVTPQRMAELRGGAAMLLAPSLWEEVCPFSVLEALAAGVPVLVSDRGGLPELVGAGCVLPAGDALAWARAVGALWSDPAGRHADGEAALTDARTRFGEARAYADLARVYGWTP